MTHVLFPIIAALIYFATPRGCDKTVNWILSGLFVLIWSFEEAIVQINGNNPVLFDGLWFDSILFFLFLWSSYLFYKAGGKIQYKLSLTGAAMCIWYAYLGVLGLYEKEAFRADYYYVESMIALYIAQLFVSGGGMMLSLINKNKIGGHHGIGASYCDSRHFAGNCHDDNGDS